jgi:hypothetical protein
LIQPHNNIMYNWVFVTFQVWPGWRLCTCIIWFVICRSTRP